MATNTDPYLHSTNVVEDAHNHDIIIGLKLFYIYNECFFTVLLIHDTCRGGQDEAITNDSSISAIQSLIERLNEACTWTERDKTIEDIDGRLDVIWQDAEDMVRATAFEQIMAIGRKHGHVPWSGDNANDLKAKMILADYLFPKSFTLQLMSQAAGGVTVVCRPDLPRSLPFAVDSRISPAQCLARVRPKEVRILKRYKAHVLKVQIKDQIYCCKLNNAGSQNSFLREFETLQRIRTSRMNNKIRVPELKGIVETCNGVVGLLSEWIETEEPDLMLLLTKKRTSIADSLKQTWADEISQTLRQLHNLNLTWGDAKTSNIVIDIHHHSWIIDFGGGFTRGWVDEALYDTQAGDLQGLENTLLDIFGKR